MKDTQMLLRKSGKQKERKNERFNQMKGYHMKYIGLFSGKIFNTKKDADIAEECCVNVSDEDERLNNKAAYENWRTNQLAKCFSCFGCPQSKK